MDARVARTLHTQAAATSLRGELRREADEKWRLAPSTAEALFLLPLVGTIVLLFSRFHEGLYYRVLQEDGPLEWLEVVGFVVAAGSALLAVRVLRRRGHAVVASLYVLLAVGCLFLAGEEVAWGQRLFGLDTPAGLREVNVQDEITIHNIVAVRTVLKLLAVLLGAFALVGTFCMRRLASRRRRELARLLAPPLFLTSAFAVLLGYNLARFLLTPDSFLRPGQDSYAVALAGEWAEGCLSYGLACFAFLTWRRLRLEEGG